MTTQPEALRLADALTTQPDCTCHASSYFECACDAIWPEQWIDHAAAELRRLHEELERCKQVCAATSEGWRSDAEKWKDQRDAPAGGVGNCVLDGLRPTAIRKPVKKSAPPSDQGVNDGR